MRWATVALFLWFSVLASAGAVSAAPAAETTPTAATVRVQLKEFKVIPAVPSVRAGRVTFVVRNVGKLAHEFVVLRTNVAPGKLPASGSKAKEVGRVGKTPVFGPGKTRRLTLTLRRGKYVLLCNVAGHYRAGQFIGFRVR